MKLKSAAICLLLAVGLPGLAGCSDNTRYSPYSTGHYEYTPSYYPGQPAKLEYVPPPPPEPVVEYYYYGGYFYHLQGGYFQRVHHHPHRYYNWDGAHWRPCW